MRYLYCVRDIKADDVGEQVMVCKADAVAVRAFSDALSQGQGYMSKYPEDYELLCSGVLHENGQIDGTDDSNSLGDFPRVVLTGKQWLLARQAETSNPTAS